MTALDVPRRSPIARTTSAFRRTPALANLYAFLLSILYCMLQNTPHSEAKLVKLIRLGKDYADQPRWTDGCYLAKWRDLWPRCEFAGMVPVESLDRIRRKLGWLIDRASAATLPEGRIMGHPRLDAALRIPVRLVPLIGAVREARPSQAGRAGRESW
jgi:hypothetical protein